MIKFLLWNLFINLAFLTIGTLQTNNTSDNILCRSCGNFLLQADEIITKLSGLSLYTFNDTLFNRKEVVVQLLSKDILFEFPVITSSHSTCLAPGEWEEDKLWFPDYSWKLCFCSECGTFVGWMFKGISSIHHPEHYRFPVNQRLDNVNLDSLSMDTENLSAEDKEFLASCEEKLKHRFTENDEEFMKVFNREPSVPPIIENWWSPGSGRRNDRRHNRRPCDRYQNRDRQSRSSYEQRRSRQSYY